MKYKVPKNLSKPKKYSPYGLFEFIINKLIQKMNSKYPLENELRTHRQWASLIFGRADSEGNNYLSRATSTYSTYIIRKGNKYKWNLEKVNSEHPNFFYSEENQDVDKDILSEFISAIDDEIDQAKRQRQKDTYQVLSLDFFKVSNTEHVYVAELDIDRDDEPKLSEGLPVQIKVGGLNFDGKVLEFDRLLSKLYFDCPYPLLKYTGRIRVVVDTVWLLEQIKERIKEIDKEEIMNLPINKFITSKCKPDKKYAFNNSRISDITRLDESQKNATIKSIENDLTLIWGPPGTGKSHTLSYILADFFRAEEKTLVCCIANVAVDALTKKLANLIEDTYSNNEFRNGSILRLGHTTDIELIQKDYLFPTNPLITGLRKQIKKQKEYLLKNDCSKQERIRIIKLIQDKSNELKIEIDSLIENAKLLFTTASKAHIDNKIYELEFDNLIIDEASMMSVPHFIALAKNISKRIIVTGDFRQLGPVVLSQTYLSQKWLHKDIFEFGKVDTKARTIHHEALSQLLVQRRSHEKICDLINIPFYQGKLISQSVFDNQKIIDSYPFEGRVITYLDLGKYDSYKVERTKKGSRFNKFSAEKILAIVSKYLKGKSNFTIGVITPYRGQVKILKEGIKQLQYSSNRKNLVKIGTIHSFQGSECDIIIFDLVDSMHEKIGRLYQHNTGERLVNVGLSRAKSKLIIVGDLNVFYSGLGNNNIEPTLISVVNNLNRFRKK